MRQIQEKRQAFTGSLGQTTNAGGVPAGDAQQASTFDRMTDNILKSKGIG